MQFPRFVESSKPGRELPQSHAQALFIETRSAHVAEEVRTRDEFHREEDPIALCEELVERDQVLVSQVGESAKLVFQAVDELCPGSGEGLDRNVAAAQEIPSEVDDTEAS